MEANAREYIKNYLHLKRFPRISLHCKLVPVQYWEYEYGLLSACNVNMADYPRRCVYNMFVAMISFHQSPFKTNASTKTWIRHLPSALNFNKSYFPFFTPGYPRFWMRSVWELQVDAVSQSGGSHWLVHRRNFSLPISNWNNRGNFHLHE